MYGTINFVYKMVIRNFISVRRLYGGSFPVDGGETKRLRTSDAVFKKSSWSDK